MKWLLWLTIKLNAMERMEGNESKTMMIMTLVITVWRVSSASNLEPKDSISETFQK